MTEFIDAKNYYALGWSQQYPPAPQASLSPGATLTDGKDPDVRLEMDPKSQ